MVFRPLRHGNRPGVATFVQLERGRELWREIHRDRECADEALTGRLRKDQKVDSLHLLTSEGGRKTIAAIKAWKVRLAKPRAAWRSSWPSARSGPAACTATLPGSCRSARGRSGR